MLFILLKVFEIFRAPPKDTLDILDIYIPLLYPASLHYLPRTKVKNFTRLI